MTRSRWIAALLAACAIISPYLGILPGWTPGLATVVCINALSLLGLNLIFGVVGMLALGQAAFMALPAYGAGILNEFGMPFALAVLIGIGTTVVIAWGMARVFVRLPGVYLAVGTLGFSYVIEGLARAFPPITGGASGLVFDRGREISGDTWYAMSVFAFAIGIAIYSWLVRGAFWRRLRTIRHDELAAAVIGIHVARIKARVFVIGCCFAAFAGIMRSYYIGVIIPEDAGVDRSLEQVGMVLVGGLGYLLGPLLGTGLINWLLIVTGYVHKFELFFYGAAFLAAVIWARDGLAGWIEPLWTKFQYWVDGPPAQRAPLVAPLTSVAAGGEPRSGVCLAVAGVSKRFGGVQALEGITFEVKFGEIFAMVGPNGAGKSTLFNIVSGIEAPSGGSIDLAGRDLADVSIDERAAFIGRSFQVARLVPDLTALENVIVRLDQIAPGLTEAQRSAAALAELDAFGLGDLANRPVRELSVGQHKLIDLTRAAVGNPLLVLLDEPAVGLTRDELTHLGQLLQQLRARGSAVLLVEHNIDFVAGIAGRGIVLDSGRPIALGEIRNILADPRVNEAYFGALT
jgi:branched-chain amino acid transport system permease protein